LKTGLSFSLLVRSSEAVLKEGGKAYAKHDIGHTVELEVTGGPSFVVRIQKLEPLPHANPLLGGLDLRSPRREVNVAIILSPDPGAKDSAAKFVGDLMSSLPKDPWKGLGWVERFTAKSLWKRWAAGLEYR
jgi:hypothetical protein